MSQPLPSLMAGGIRISNHKRRILDAISRQIGEKVRVVQVVDSVKSVQLRKVLLYDMCVNDAQ